MSSGLIQSHREGGRVIAAHVAAGDAHGAALAVLGDVDGDGTDDLFIGTERGQNDIGRAYLLTQLSSE